MVAILAIPAVKLLGAGLAGFLIKDQITAHPTDPDQDTFMESASTISKFVVLGIGLWFAKPIIETVIEELTG